MTWRPLPEEGRGQPRSLRDSLDGFAHRLGAPEAAALATVFAKWEEIVGPGVAAHARPVSLVRGALVVAVDQPVWATQLRYLGTRVVERIGEMAGPGVVERLEVRVEGQKGR